MGIFLAILLVGGLILYGIWARADIWKFYPSTCLGNWEGVDRALGAFDLSEGAPYTHFGPENSARLASADGNIYCANFKSSEDRDLLNNDIAQAKLTLALAYQKPQPSSTVETIGETLRDLNPVPSEATTTEEVASSSRSGSEASTTEPEVAPSPSSSMPAPENFSPEPPPEPPAEIILDQTPVEAPLPESPPEPAAFWRRFVAYAQETSSTPNELSTSSSPKPTTLSVPFDITSSSLGEADQAPQEQVLIDLLEVTYSIDGDKWLLLGDIVVKDAARVTYDLPLASWDEVSKLQVRVKAILAGSEVPIVFLEGMELEIIPVALVEESEEGSQPEITTSTEDVVSSTEAIEEAVQAEELFGRRSPSDEVDIDPLALHSCEVAPFTTRLRAGEDARIALRLHPSKDFILTGPGLRLGRTPTGVSAEMEFEADEYFIHLIVSHRAFPGSYGLNVLYWQEEQEPRSNTTCHYNLVIEK